MFISTQSWHGKVYRWWYKSNYETDREPTHANLCPYVRRVLLRAPLRFLLVVGKVGPIHCASLAWSTIFLTPLSVTPAWFGYGYAVALITVILSVGLMCGLAAFADSPMNKRIDLRMKEKAASFCHIIVATFKPLHDRICPDLQFREPRA